MRLKISTLALVCALSQWAQPAAACSDLANICEMQAQHFQQQMDIAATPPYYDEGYDDEGYYDDSYDSGWSAPSYTMEEMNQWIAGEQARQQIEQARRQQARQDILTAHEQRLRDDPGYRQFVEGHWLPMENTAPDSSQACILHFSRMGQGVLLMGPGGDYQGAFLALYGPMVPAPDAVETIQVTLEQTGDPAQTVRVFNTVAPWLDDLGSDKMGIVFFAVPTIEAALAGMTDDLGFRLSRNREELLDLQWHGGLAARDQMQACHAARQANLASSR